MTKEVDVKNALINHFFTLNDFCGIEFIKDNVALKNKHYKPEAGSTWFNLSFNTDEPQTIGNFNTNQERYNGFLQIDINTPIDVGEDEAEDIYIKICELFEVGKIIGDAQIEKVYSPISTEETDFYRKVVRVNFYADVDNN